MSDSNALSPLKRAFLALEAAEARAAALEGAAREPIAIIGLGCRVPGADGPSAFWELLRNGVDATGRVPGDRWDADALFDPDPEQPGCIVTRSGGFLGAVDQFDAAFFGISPREAQGMDPQQRLLLEVAWEALEHAGQAPDSLSHTPTGVYVGLCSSDYAYMQLKHDARELLDAHFTSGIAHSIASGRLSYLLGLQGPSLTIDTACSSSLVAVHLACQSLRAGEVRMAMAGGVNLILSPDLFIALSHSRMLAPDGRCKTFDAAADGFARGEGCGVVVLKRLSDAHADGDRVLAVIRGTAVNQDGPSSSLTAPNGPSQEAVIRKALAQAAVLPRQVSYLEAHGTGTQLGDPLEVHALGAVFAGGSDRERPLVLGSVKTNIGHLEAAAGVVGLVKMVLSLQHHTIPAHLHFKTPSPHIAWADLPFQVPASTMPWEAIDGRRIGGISSFGFSGTNAHVVIEEAPGVDTSGTPVRSSALLVLSARDEKALSALAGRYAEAVAGRSETDLADICFTAGAGRAHFSHRATVAARSVLELGQRLTALAAGRDSEGVHSAHVDRRDLPRVAFLFTGQGAQYPAMAKGLYETSPVFRRALDRCATGLEHELPRPLLETLFAAGSRTLDETAWTQPALFSVEFALSELWRSWGIEPSVVIGHSVGEYAAACVAGVFTLESALKAVAARGRLMQALPPGGAMCAVFAPEARVASTMAGERRPLAIAAVNGPEQTVVSGAADAVADLARTLTAQGVRCQPLSVSHAFHSPLMAPMVNGFERELSDVVFGRPRIRLISNLTGAQATDEIATAGYWARHVSAPVRFGDGLRTLATTQADCWIEIGPHPTLLPMVAPSEAGRRTLAPSLRKGRDDWEQITESLASLYRAGARIDWKGVDAGCARRIVALPSYPFQRERHWFATADAAPRQVAGTSTGHPLLGSRLRTSGSEVIFESTVAANRPGFVRDHCVQGHVVMPAAAYLEALDAAARELFETDDVVIEEVEIREAMLFEGPAARTLQIVCGAPVDGLSTATVSSAPSAGEGPWARHVTATLRHRAASRPQAPYDEPRARCREAVPVDDFYGDLLAHGLAFGPFFRSLTAVWRGRDEALGEIGVSTDSAGTGYRAHPLVLDGALQVLAAAIRGPQNDTLYLPIGIGQYTCYRRTSERVRSHVIVRQSEGDLRRADVVLFDEAGVIAELSDLRLRHVQAGALERLGERQVDEWMYDVRWIQSEWDSQATADPAVPALVAAAGQAVERIAAETDMAAHDAFVERLEALCVDYTVAVMRQLGWMPAVGDTVAEGPLADALGVMASHRRLWGRLLGILAEAGFLEQSADKWVVTRPFITPDPDAERLRLAASWPAGQAELELVGRVAAGFADALRGRQEPMQLLFPAGALDTAERLYRDSTSARFYNGLLSVVVGEAVKARRGRRPLRILEVGGGTGGSTAHLLRHLDGDDFEYTFTDVGPLFVERARERFGARPSMRFSVLDLDRDPDAQGLGAPGFDLVVASNVVHATTDLKRTLARLRSLLVPGGLLAMLEVTEPQRWFDLTVGLTSGWWAFTDTDIRPAYPTISRDAWLRLIASCDFASAAALPDAGGQRGLSRQALILARAQAEAPVRREWLIFADRGGTLEALAARLTARGDACTVVSAGDRYARNGSAARIEPVTAADYRRLIREAREAGRRFTGVVHAWALDASGPQGAADCAVSATLIAQAIVAEAESPRLWLVSRGSQQAGADVRALSSDQATIWGVGRTLALEHPELRTVLIDLDPAADASRVDELINELAETGTEGQIAVRHGARRVARLSRLRRTVTPLRSETPYRLAPEAAGSLERFRLEPLPRTPPGRGEVEVAVEASGLNFKDLLNVLGMYPGDPGPLGGECAGRIVAVGPGVSGLEVGDDVLAIAAGSLASHVIARAEFVHRRPPGMTAVEGASVPIAYLTAAFCLRHLAGVTAGDRVLVHAGAGGVGMAAIRIAQRAGAEVFATAGSERKRALLRSCGVAHVFDSRSTRFADEILAATNGRGVDVVLNSLSGDAIEASFNALSPGGCFLEIGKRGIKTPAWVEALGRGVRYHIVDWGETGSREPVLIGSLLRELITEVAAGTLPSLPRHTFGLDQAAAAFRLMAEARHTGKIVISHGGPMAPAVRRDGSYLVTGGLAGLGLVVARWLAERGAGRIVLVSRRGVTPEAQPILDDLRALGAVVVAEAIDATDADGMGALLARLRESGPPLRGVIHSAGVLDDAGLLQQDPMKFARVCAPKLLGTRLLEALTQGEALDMFVLFSSVAAVLGSPGQANHAAANAFLDAVAHDRRGRGLPALSINWGPWSGVGAAADRGMDERLAGQGLGVISPERGLVALERALESGAAQVVVLPARWDRYVGHLGVARTTPFLSAVAGSRPEPTRNAAPRATAAARTPGLREQVEGLSEARQRALVGSFVRERALRCLGLDPAQTLDHRTPFAELGLDSLLAVELRNQMGTALGVTLPATTLFDYPTLETLIEYLFTEVLHLGPSPAGEPSSGLAAIEELSDEEVERQLAARAERRG